MLVACHARVIAFLGRVRRRQSPHETGERIETGLLWNLGIWCEYVHSESVTVNVRTVIA